VAWQACAEHKSPTQQLKRDGHTYIQTQTESAIELDATSANHQFVCMTLSKTRERKISASVHNNYTAIVEQT
jgi:hypothetical protein